MRAVEGKRVVVNGRRATSLMWVRPHDWVMIDGVAVEDLCKFHFLVNKTFGSECFDKKGLRRGSLLQSFLPPEVPELCPVAPLLPHCGGLMLMSNCPILRSALNRPPSFSILPAFPPPLSTRLSRAFSRHLPLAECEYGEIPSESEAAFSIDSLEEGQQISRRGIYGNSAVEELMNANGSQWMDSLFYAQNGPKDRDGHSSTPPHFALSPLSRRWAILIEGEVSHEAVLISEGLLRRAHRLAALGTAPSFLLMPQHASWYSDLMRRETAEEGPPPIEGVEEETEIFVRRRGEGRGEHEGKTWWEVGLLGGDVESGGWAIEAIFASLGGLLSGEMPSNPTA
uniref:Uncharacterized protein n=1 Tax=Chromera velia CCMP2878 TaxID=1169474 RepID=A0A0G4HNS2_9ALVE|eukprot:Cvel_1205.t1-p1 / transcript=Cvel_1205.t1 / gene=Cvel_1205 / organism=Chromera_velia_CCMP2878 / gene_product=hypothetical protein / transcript_product=hypothetical protein / location=Cvel_scaffold40:40119-43310(-) / protein_length=339 / sequence_SO=supercontig / SO=protein_coding / is_pseudo=false